MACVPQARRQLFFQQSNKLEGLERAQGVAAAYCFRLAFVVTAKCMRQGIVTVRICPCCGSARRSALVPTSLNDERSSCPTPMSHRGLPYRPTRPSPLRSTRRSSPASAGFSRCCACLGDRRRRSCLVCRRPLEPLDRRRPLRSHRRRLHRRRRHPAVGEGLGLCCTDVGVADYQTVHKGDLIVEIDASDYRAQLLQAEANLAAAQATLANLANQKDVQRALVRQAEATIQATQADLLRYDLEAKRQRDLLQTRIAGTQQTGRAGRRQRTAHQCATAAEQRPARSAESPAGQPRRAGEPAAGAGARRRGAGDAGAQQRRLHPHRLARRRPGRAAPGAPWPVRQCRHAGDLGRAAAAASG